MNSLCDRFGDPQSLVSPRAPPGTLDNYYSVLVLKEPPNGVRRDCPKLRQLRHPEVALAVSRNWSRKLHAKLQSVFTLERLIMRSA
jgi:hypothetical protein